jgi:Protein of unknown function (DUF1572)
MFKMYQALGEKAMAQLADEKLFWQANEESNSIATIVKHMWGNMQSRWTDFLTTDGEKPWRQRDAEFENDLDTRDAVLAKWHEGWQYVYDALESLTDDELERIVYIRNEGMPVIEAIDRQVAHYAYHVGQIVYIAKLHAGDWQSLTIPRNKSKDYNANKFSQEKEEKHFTDEFLQ